ncbi:MAG: PAS domain S-box protein [Armatimonadetes bacterium]|nr:PAS domain S-box protein [Armatimonadota bacterium]
MHVLPCAKERHAVLVVIDDQAVGEALASLLAQEGLEVERTSNAAQALAYLEVRTPCLAIVDTALSSDDGLALCSALRHHPRGDDLAVAAITVRGDSAMAAAAARAGATDIIHTPLSVDTLRFRVWAQLRLHEARLEQHRLNERLSLISRAATDGIILIGGDSRINFWNAAAESMFGYTSSEVEGRPVHSLLVPPAQREEADHAARLFAGNGEGRAIGTTVILKALRKSGEEFPVELSLSSAYVHGEWWALGIVRDITQRLRFEQRLRDSENRLRWILNSMPVGIVISGADRRVRWANQAALDMVQAEDAEEIIGLPCNAALCQAEGEPCLLHGDHPEPARSETLLPRRTDPPLPVLRSLHRLNLDGESVYLESFVDLTARRQLEAELGHARKLEAVGQLAAGIAHEINTPIQYVGDSVHFLREAFEGLSQVLSAYRESARATAGEAGLAALAAAEEEADLEFMLDNAPASLDRCFDGIDRVATIVRAMKDFAHPDQREKSPADLNKAIGSTLTIARNEYKYVAEVECSLGNLPLVSCHIGDLNQVFLNIIVNAAHAIGEAVGDSGKLGTIRVTTRREGDMVRLAIADTGHGIPDEIAGRVFDPFFTTKAVGKGSGQGLAIARSIVVEKHGGTLTFTSEVGQGTEFVIKLPIEASGVKG